MIQRLVFALLLTLFFCNKGFGQTYRDTWDFNVRVSNGSGGWRNTVAFIDLRNPDKGDSVGFGTAIDYVAANSDKKNCNDDKYGYIKVSIDEEWHGHLKLGGDRVGAVDAQRFWDWVYADMGYERVTKLDFSKNCHGYAFGVGDWPYSAEGPLGRGPFPTGSIKSPCYEHMFEPKKAKVAVEVKLPGNGASAVFGTRHSIKVVGAECDVSAGDQTPNADAIGDDTVGPGTIKKQAIVESTEQFRASGIYRQTSDCPESVVLTKARLNKYTFALFKQN